MNSISFSTDLPYDHLQRTVDTLRRMGFSLVAVSLRMKGEIGKIQITYGLNAAPLEPQTLGSRISAMPGVADVLYTSSSGTAEASNGR